MPTLDQNVAALRQFNRFYTKAIGVLRPGFLDSPYSLTESRILYEIAHRQPTTAAALAAELGLDAGYLSRILQRFQQDGLLAREPSRQDRRSHMLSLTSKGNQAATDLDRRSQEHLRTRLGSLSTTDQQRAVTAAQTLQALLGPVAPSPEPYLIRLHRPGDMGWIVYRHAVLYTSEYGWNDQLEALVAEVVAGFLRRSDTQRERCWIAERHREPVGSVFVMCQSEAVAQLRMLLVEPSVRGLGIGRRLVEECIRFARQAGYRKITLWTHSILTAALHIYERQGFVLVHEEPHNSFGPELIGQTWELTL